MTQCEAPCRPKLENSEEILTAPGLAFALAIETRRRVGVWTRHGTDGEETDGPWILGWVPLLDRDSAHLIHGFCEDCAYDPGHAMHWMPPRTTIRRPSIHPSIHHRHHHHLRRQLEIHSSHNRIGTRSLHSLGTVPGAAKLYDHHQHQPRAPATARPPFGFPGSPVLASIILSPPQVVAGTECFTFLLFLLLLLWHLSTFEAHLTLPLWLTPGGLVSCSCF